jgi:dipeptide/tripeptide permease
MPLVITTFILITLGSGAFADRIYHLVSRCRERSRVGTTLIFSLLIYLINIIGLWFCTIYHTQAALLAAFNCLQFTRKYILLSLFVGLIIAIIAGLFRRFVLPLVPED